MSDSDIFQPDPEAPAPAQAYHPQDEDRDWSYRDVLSISGGKDSTAMYLLAMEYGANFDAVFADVGNELEATYEYVRRLPERTGGPAIKWVKSDFTDRFEARKKRIPELWGKQGIEQRIIDRAVANMVPSGNPFLDLCLLRGGFPSSQRRYCTEHLKVVPIKDGVYRPLWDSGFTPRSWQGLRREESRARSNLDHVVPWSYREKDPATVTYRPLLAWTLDDVWEMHRRHGLKPNPLYLQGFTRVGCGPCIFSRKSEIRLLASLYPEAIDRIREWEHLAGMVGKRDPSVATFFAGSDLPGNTGPITAQTHGIDVKVKWSKTSRGGRQYNLFEESEVLAGCSLLGLCE